ncbi:MAG: GIY-YIG nuclease family protein [Deltaproteobacteria bacterium]|nr:GIY-YIG nuclease family protein [Deltaproteobacteria bacterium]
MYYTYVLQSKKDNKFYIDFTKDLKNRLAIHNSGKIRATAVDLVNSFVAKKI